jgi:cellulose synthase operon protein C
MKRLNLKFLLIVVAVVAVLGGGGAVAYKIQRRRSVEALLVQARAAHEAGDIAKADGLYAHYLGFRGDDAATAADYGLMLARAADSPGSQAKALAVLAQAVRHDPTRSDARGEIVRIAMNRTVQRYDQALGQLEALMAAKPDDGGLESQAAQCLEAERKYPEAVAMYTKAIVHAPNLVDAYARLAVLLRTRLAKPAEADRVMDQLVERNPDSFRAHLERGRQRLQSGLDGAERDIARALDLAHDDVDVLATAADLALSKGNVERAREMAGRCLKARADEPRYHDLAYRIEARAGRPVEAEAALRKGIETAHDPEGRLRLLMNLAGLLITLGNYPEADRTIGLMTEQKARSEFVGYLRSRLLAAQGKWRDAAKALDDSHGGLVNVPEMAYEADLLLARCRERLGEADLRHAALQRAISLNPAGLPARLELARALASSGRVEDAIAQYRSVEGDAPGVRPELARLLIRRNLARPPASRDWAEVDRALAEAERSSPGSPEVRLLRAEALVNRGRAEAARDELKLMAKESPKSDGPPIALALLAAKEGRTEAALELLDRAGRELGDRASLRLARADAWVARGGEGALKELGRLAEGLEKLPEADRPGLLRGLAEARLRLGDLAGARAILETLSEQSPDDLGLKLARFDLAIRMDDDAEMKAILGAIGGEDEAAVLLARARYLAWSAARGPARGEAARAQLAEARQLLALAATRRPGWLPAEVATAYVDDLAGEQDGAIKGYLRAIELGDRSPDIATRAVQLLQGRDRVDQADEVVRKTIADDPSPKPAGFYRLAAEVAMRAKDPARALDYATRAVPTSGATPGDRLWRGRLLWAAGKAPQAEPDLVAAASSAPEADAPDAWTTLVAYLVATGRKARAEDAFEQARRKLPERIKALTLARCLAILERPDQAQEQYRAAVSAAPDDMPTLDTATDIALRLGKFDDAKEFLRKLLARQADAPGPASRTRRILSILLATSGDLRQAQESLKVLGLVGDDASRRPSAAEATADLRAKANVLALRGGRRNRRAAVEALGAIVARGEATPGDRLLLARALDVEGDWSKAREQLQLALADAADSPALLTFYIWGLLRHEEGRGAGPWFEKLEKLAPSSIQTAELKARLAQAEGRPGDAAAVLVAFARATPGSAITSAMLLETIGRVGEAEALFRELASKDKRPEAGLPLAVFLGRRGRVPEAVDLCDRAWTAGARAESVSQASVAVLYASMAGEDACRRVVGRMEEAIRKAPENAQLRFDLANVRILLGDYRDAEATFRQIYEKDKDNAASANNLAWLLSIQDGKVGEAIALIDDAIKLAGPMPSLLDTRGMASFAAGKVDAAVGDLEDATVSGPTPTRFFHLAQAYLAANRAKEAKEAMQEAKTLGLDEAKLHPRERKEFSRLLVELAKR